MASLLLPALQWLTYGMSLLLITAVIMPLIPTGKWWVRLWDFPKVQFLSLAGVELLLLLGMGLGDGWQHAITVNLVITGVCCVGLLMRILPFTFLWPRDVAQATPNASPSLKLAIVNLMYDNPTIQQAVEKIRALDVDLLLLIEINEQWDEAMSDIKTAYPHHCQVIRDDGLGLAVWSKMQLENPEVKHLVSRNRASLFADLHLPDGRKIKYVGLHPTPPGLIVPEDERVTDSSENNNDSLSTRYDSWIRDAELIMVAKAVAKSPDEHWVVAGDFNDVAWSHTTRLFKRLSGLKDPRIGRRLLNSYHADHALMRYPLDHVFISPEFELQKLKRLYLPGSDHFTILVNLHLAGQQTNDTQADSMDHVESKERLERGKERAAVRENTPESTAVTAS